MTTDTRAAVACNHYLNLVITEGFESALTLSQDALNLAVTTVADELIARRTGSTWLGNLNGQAIWSSAECCFDAPGAVIAMSDLAAFRMLIEGAGSLNLDMLRTGPTWRRADGRVVYLFKAFQGVTR